ncbi:MAG: hypothetical protein E7597_01950 [Ruminococcaceae bacterium]|nr:hypothetical protein [Oscillospiraceae bacterium]
MTKRISLFLCIALLLSVLSLACQTSSADTSVGEILIGDTDGNGTVNTTDYVLLRSYLTGRCALSESCLAASDVNFDGVVSITDLVSVRKHISGKNPLVCTHNFSSWAETETYNCLGKIITSRTCSLCSKTEKSYTENGAAVRSLDGKNVMFIGNSFIYYGYCVNNGSQTKTDKGYFKQLCTANGENVNVYDYVWGGRNLDYIYENYLVDCTEDFLSTIDYVFLSEAGENNSALVSDIQKIIDLYPSSKTEFYYLCHSYTYQAGHSNIKNALSTLQDKGIGIVNWGKLVYDVWKGNESVPGATKTYDKNTFIVNKNDTHHENMLSGYITAQMAYCAITGKSAVGQSYEFCTDTSINSKYDPDAFISSYYNAGTTNFDAVFDSVPDMLGLQTLMDKYLEKYNFSLFDGGEHSNTEYQDNANDSALASAGLKAHECSLCGSISLEETDENGVNHMYISNDDVSAAGYSTVKDYMLAGLGNVFYKTTSGWGRAGYSSIQGMAASCDGVRGSKGKTDGSETYWKVNNLGDAYNANGKTAASGEQAYISLIGYDLTNAINTRGVGMFFNRVNAPDAFDLLGGVTQSDGSIEWKVLATFDANSTYMKYDDMTVAFFADFDATQIDCVQIGIKSITNPIFFMSELELYQ